MKVVQVLPFFLPDSLGGTEVYVWSLSKYLQGQGVDVEVVIPNYSSKEFRHYTYDGIPVTKYPEPTLSTRQHVLGLRLPEGLAFFKAYLQQLKPDAVHFHGIYGGTGILVDHLEACASLGIPVYYTMHLAGDVCRTQTLVYEEKNFCDGKIRPVRCAECTMKHQHKSGVVAKLMTVAGKGLQLAGVDAGLWNSPLGTGLSQVQRMYDLERKLKRISAACSKVVALTDWYKKILLLNGVEASKIQVVKQGLPYSGEWEAIEPLTFNDSRSIKVVFAGRIDALKGVDILLQALQALTEVSVELSIFGKDDHDDYSQYCHDLSKDNQHVHWRGILKRSQVINAFAQHDILCLPSTFSEMSPLVIQEAFAAGIPVLASDVYGNAEQIRHGENGLLFPFKSTAGLAIQLKRLADEKGLLNRLKQQVQSPVSFDLIGARYLEIYKGN